MYYEYDPDTIQELHEIQANMIKDFHDLCTRHEIPYFAIGGTLLGAIRHKDFIPWDDDVDLGMLREDYNRFLDIATEEYSDKYTLWTPERKNMYCTFVPKFALNNSKFITAFASNAGICDMGIFLDIFVFENVEPDKLKRKIRQVTFTKFLHIEATGRRRFAVGHGLTRIIKLLIKYCLHLFVRLFHITPEKTNARYLKQTISKKETGFVTCFGDETTKNALTQKKELFPIQEVPFGKGTICIPHNWDVLLTQSYGDYMQLPPEEYRENHAPALLQFPGKIPQYFHD